MSGKRQMKHFRLYLHCMFYIVIFIGISFLVLTIENNRYQKTLDTKESLIRKTSELRQSSNDLTRLARTYIITSDQAYKGYFNQAVAIRDGKLPRPENYHLSYWDIYAMDKKIAEPGKLGEKIAFVEFIKQDGITEKELSLLIESKNNSDLLVDIERAAMDFTDLDAPNVRISQEKALNMLTNEKFISLKSKVMLPIVEAEKSIKNRTQTYINNAKNRLNTIFIILYILSGFLMYFIFKVGKEFKIIIGCSIVELQDILQNLGKGDFLTPIKVDKDTQESVVGRIAKMQHELAALNLGHFKAIIDSSDDAIISKDTQGIISSWNKGAESIFGYSEDEAIGKSMLILIPDDKVNEEKEILEKIHNKKTRVHYIMQRKTKDGRFIDLSASISPVYNENGNVVGASIIARDITSELKAQREIEYLAFYDPLTKLANRRLLFKRLDEMLLSAQEKSLPLALLFIDLDDFKLLNDSKGHAAGDALLKSVAKRLCDSVRDIDLVSRFGGDEFLILLSGHGQLYTSDDWVIALANKIKERLRKPHIIESNLYTCTSSIGGFVYRGESMVPVEIIHEADKAMYIAKKDKNKLIIK